jgi:hypothetical protein
VFSPNHRQEVELDVLIGVIHGTKDTMDLENWSVSPEGGRDTTIQPGPIPVDLSWATTQA